MPQAIDNQARSTIARRLARLLASVLGATLVYAAISKLRTPYECLDDVYRYRLTPPPYGTWIAVALPHVELVVGLALVLGILRIAAATAALALIAVFVADQTWVVYRGWTIPCACFGSDPDATVSASSL